MMYTPDKLSEELASAYHTLHIHTGNAQTKAVLTECRRMLAEAKQRILLKYAEDPKALGANEAARNAAVDDLVKESREHVNGLEREAQIHRDMADLARITVDGLRAQLRCLEVYAALNGAEGGR